MSKFEELIKRIHNLSNDLRFSEIKKILEFYGYVMTSPRGGSSHYTFRKKNSNTITVPKHEPIKKVYIIMIKNIIEGEESND